MTKPSGWSAEGTHRAGGEGGGAGTGRVLVEEERFEEAVSANGVIATLPDADDRTRH